VEYITLNINGIRTIFGKVCASSETLFDNHYVSYVIFQILQTFKKMQISLLITIVFCIFASAIILLFREKM